MSEQDKPIGPTGKIEFIENHRPALPSGDYEITVSQSIEARQHSPATKTNDDGKVDGGQLLVNELFKSQTRKFSVQGPRFALEPQVVRAVFPPAGSLGDHSNVLPHISFNRSTLPWERFTQPLEDTEQTRIENATLEHLVNDVSDESDSHAGESPFDTAELKTPWMALLLFDQDELVEKVVAKDRKQVVEGVLTAGRVSGPKACLLKRVIKEKKPFWKLEPGARASTPKGEFLEPLFTYEHGQQDGDPVTVIDVAADLLKAVLPSREDVQLLGHVRQAVEPAGDEIATLIANRLPKADHMSVVHLVSLEGEYGTDGGDIWSLPEDAEFVRLVSLKSWRFTCIDEKHSFKGLLHHLNKEYLFVLDSKLVEFLPGTSEEEGLHKKIKEVFARQKVSVAEGTTVKLERDAWIIEDKDKHQRFAIRREKAEILRIYENQEHLTELNIAFRSKLPGNENDCEIEKDVRNKFASLNPPVEFPPEATIWKEDTKLWLIDEPGGAKYSIRQEETDSLGVYENQKLLLKFDFPKGKTQHEIENIVRDKVAALSPLAEGVEIKKETAQAWRVTDPQGSIYMIRKNGNGDQYEVHRCLPHTLRLQTDHLQVAEGIVEQGFVPMPHEMRQGNRSVSWYRGPLAPGRVDQVDQSNAIENENGKQQGTEGSLRAHSADQLVHYNPANGMFDVSYAAAWELGRLLTLQNEKVAVSLLNWKRRHRHAQERQRAMADLEHLPIVGRPVASDFPADVTRWFADLSLLRGVPFNYLVPDERMLPQESIRFFWVDPEWIRCVHDGAFSIGRVLPLDHERDAAHHPNLLGKPHGIVTGFLLRSEVVSGWPDLQVDGYDETVSHENYEHPTLEPRWGIHKTVSFEASLQSALNEGDDSVYESFNFPKREFRAVSTIVPNVKWQVNLNNNEELYLIEKRNEEFEVRLENKLPLLRMERLSPNVMLCMFAGDIRTVDVHQKPEALHFGVNRRNGAFGSYYRELKSHTGGELPAFDAEVILRNGSLSKENRVISIKKFNTAIQTRLQEFPDEALMKLAENSMGREGLEEFKRKFKEAANSATSAQFALQMTQGVQKVRFVRGPGKGVS